MNDNDRHSNLYKTLDLSSLGGQRNLCCSHASSSFWLRTFDVRPHLTITASSGSEYTTHYTYTLYPATPSPVVRFLFYASLTNKAFGRPRTRNHWSASVTRPCSVSTFCSSPTMFFPHAPLSFPINGSFGQCSWTIAHFCDLQKVVATLLFLISHAFFRSSHHCLNSIYRGRQTIKCPRLSKTWGSGFQSLLSSYAINDHRPCGNDV